MQQEELIDVLAQIYRISGFRVSLHGTDFREVAAYPAEKLPFCAFLHRKSGEEYERCLDCDRRAAEQALSTGETVIYTCRHGLTEAISPLYNFGVHTGFLMMGQIRRSGADTRPQRDVAARLSDTEEEMNAVLAEIHEVPHDLIQAYVRIMTICAEYLTLSNAVSTPKPTVGQLTRQYIANHYSEKITIRDICAYLNYSKSTLLSAFKDEFGTTIGAYLTEVRLTAAKKLLRNSEMSINDVAMTVGFGDQSYFAKVFSATYGITPTAYRKERFL